MEKSFLQVFLDLFRPVAYFLFDWMAKRPWACLQSVLLEGDRERAQVAKAAVAAVWFLYLIGSTAYQLKTDPEPAMLQICFIVLIAWIADPQRTNGEGLVRGTLVTASPAPTKKQSNSRVKIGNVEVPSEVEGLHFLIAGSTGTGKSQAINSLLQTLRNRGDKVLIVDSGGEAMAALFREGDKLLNPLDSRSEQWSIGGEMSQSYESDRAAEMMIPASSGGSSREWELYSQSLVSAVIQRLHERGELTNERLVYFLTIAKSQEIEALVAGLPAQTLMDAGAAKMLSSVRGIVGSYLPAYRFLHPGTGADGFSIRKWVQNEEQSWLWLPYRDDQLSSLRGLISCWLGEAVNSTLSMRPSATRRIWIVADELASLGRIAGLADGLTKGRKYGLRVVAGLQSVSQLRAVFGKEESTTLLSCLSNLLCLRAADGETAEYFSRAFGQQEILRMDTSESSQGSSSSSLKHVTQAAIMPSEISGLPPLVGYVRLAHQPGIVTATRIPICHLGDEVMQPFVSK